MDAQCKTRWDEASLDQLTERQIEVFELLSRHKTSKMIANSLDVRRNTVDKHIEAVRRKWNCDDRFQAAEIYRALRDRGTNYPPEFFPVDGIAAPEPNRLANLPATAVFELADVLAIGPRQSLEDPEPKGLKALDSRFGKAWRIAAILVGAVLIGIILAWALMFANGITEMLSGSLRP